MRAAAGSTRTCKPVERVVGRVGHDRRPSTPGQRDEPVAARAAGSRVSRARTAAWSRLSQASSAAMVPAMPSLPTFMPRPMPLFCRKAARTSALPPGDDAGGRTAQELVRAVDRDVGAAREEAAQIVFRRGVDDDRHARRVRDLGHLLQRQAGRIARCGARRRTAPPRCAAPIAPASWYGRTSVACPTGTTRAPASRIACSTGAP